MIRSVLCVATTCALIAGCGPQQEQQTQQMPSSSVRELIQAARYAEAVAEADRIVRSYPSDANHLIMLSVAQAAAAAPSGDVQAATANLMRAANITSRGQAIEMFVIEAITTGAFQGLRFAASAQICLAGVNAWVFPQGDLSASQGAAALLQLSAHGAQTGANVPSIRGLVDEAHEILSRATNGYSFMANDMRRAWLAYVASVTIADGIARRGEYAPAGTAAELAIRIAERNPSLAQAIVCDSSSPHATLMAILQHDPPGLQRYQRVIAPAQGCTPGNYAP